jgi:hypothetical protein
MHWAIVAALVLSAACGPNGAPVSQDAPLATSTPLPWQPAPSPTAGPPTYTARPIAPPQALPTGVAPRSAPVPPTATPTITRPPVPTLTPPPRAQCRFDTGAAVAVPANVFTSAVASPGTVPPFYQGTPGWQILVVGEALPGVHLELHLPTTTFVAGAVIRPEVWVKNTSSSGLAVLVSAGILDEHQTPIAFDRASSERSVLNGGAHSRPGPFLANTVVPSGETWSLPSIVQLPFDANQATNLVAYATLGWAQSPDLGSAAAAASEFTTIQLKLTRAGPAQMLNLEVRADRHQWCVRATTADGGVPTGPLTASLIASTSLTDAPSSTMFIDPQVITGNTWAGYWDGQSFAPQNLTVWLGGQNYVTAMAQATVTSNSP